LSAAECNFASGFTNEKGLKIGVSDPRLTPQAVFYDAKFGLETPQKLLMSTGMRALDHAVELMYNPSTPEFPTKDMALKAVSSLFDYLPRYSKDPKNEEYITNLFLASYASLGFLGTTLKGPIGLSHTLGYALGSPYSIPHGITSCLTLGHVVQLQADDPSRAEQIARILPFIGLNKTGNDREDARKVGTEIVR
jgi:alcohol dehydrogenase class IV